MRRSFLFLLMFSACCAGLCSLATPVKAEAPRPAGPVASTSAPSGSNGGQVQTAQTNSAPGSPLPPRGAHHSDGCQGANSNAAASST